MANKQLQRCQLTNDVKLGITDAVQSPNLLLPCNLYKLHSFSQIVTQQKQ